MKYIKREDIDNLVPNDIDISLAYYKGLAKDNTLDDKYFQLYSIYYRYLELYLDNVLNITDNEKYINNINKNFKQVDDNEKDIYQYMSNNKYFYIRNTLYVEKLSKEDIYYLLNNPNTYDSKVKEIIARTFSEVITTSLLDRPVSNIFYGPNNLTYATLNNSLVIGIRFNEEDSDLYKTEDEWFKDYSLRRMIINNLLNNMPKEVGSVEIKYIEYFEESVKKY